MVHAPSSEQSEPQDAKPSHKSINPNNTATDYTELLAFYRKHLNENKTGYRATGWGNPIIQWHSFDLITRLDGFGNGVRVLDVGCGIGDLLLFLRTRNISVDYVGVDVSPDMIRQAQALHPDATFLLRDITTEPLTDRFDYVVCSGTLNLRLVEHEQWLHTMIRSMYEHSQRGMAFNMLSQHYANDHEDFQHSGEFYFADPADIFNYCQTLTRRVSLNHSDNIESFTLYLYREESTTCDRQAAAYPFSREYDDSAHALFTYACDLQVYQWAEDFLLRFEPSIRTQHALAQLYLNSENTEQLFALSEQALANNPNDHFFHFCMGISQHRRDNMSSALDHLGKAIALEPNNDHYLSHAICLLIFAKKRSHALSLIPRISSAAQRAFLEGHLWHHAAAYQRARHCYENALALSPNYSLAQQAMDQLPPVSSPDPEFPDLDTSAPSQTASADNPSETKQP
ncbi:MAG: methyltransferase domain-containing protein [Gammaproteobacteria bacterium]